MDMKMGLSALKSFYIMQILLERTDEAHSPNATQIRDILETQRYLNGLICEL